MSLLSRLPLYVGSVALALLLLQILWAENSNSRRDFKNNEFHVRRIGSRDLPKLEFREEETEKETTESSTTKPVKITSPKKKQVPKPVESILDAEKVTGKLPVQNSKNVTYVLVTSYFRAGSRFLGEILQQNSKTFYHFEPIHQLNTSLGIKDEQMPEPFSLMKDLMYCNFTSPLATKFLLWAKEKDNTFLTWRNRFLKEACSQHPDLCFRSDFVRSVCLRSPWQVMNVNGSSLHQVGQFVLDNPELDIRVLHLVRDPRGIISSREELPWCSNSSCSDFRILCGEMNSDYKAFKKFRKLRPDRFFQLRLEDLAINPQPVSKQLLGSLGLPYTNTVRKFLKLNTKARAQDYKKPYSTRPNTSTTPFEWLKKMTLDKIKEIQIGCMSTLKNYGYVLVTSSQQLSMDPSNLYSSEKSLLRT